jgi:hypothetical protein
VENFIMGQGLRSGEAVAQPPAAHSPLSEKPAIFWTTRSIVFHHHDEVTARALLERNLSRAIVHWIAPENPYQTDTGRRSRGLENTAKKEGRDQL